MKSKPRRSDNGGGARVTIGVHWPFSRVTTAAARATRALRSSPRQRQETARKDNETTHTVHNADKGGPK